MCLGNSGAIAILEGGQKVLFKQDGLSPYAVHVMEGVSYSASPSWQRMPMCFWMLPATSGMGMGQTWTDFLWTDFYVRTVFWLALPELRAEPQDSVQKLLRKSSEFVETGSHGSKSQSKSSGKNDFAAAFTCANP